MPFWGALIRGSLEIGGWLGRNSGNIGSAVKAISEATGKGNVLDNRNSEALSQAEIEENGPRFFSTLFTDLQQAADKLRDTAVRETPNDFVNGTGEFRPIDISGFWPRPDTFPGRSAPATADEINRCLSAQGIPQIYVEKGQQISLGDAIARKMFVNRESAKTIRAHSLGEFKLQDGSKITGAFAYYSIPLGNPGFDGFHTHIHLLHGTTRNGNDFLAASETEESDTRTTKPMSIFEAGDTITQTTTISATFSGMSGTDQYVLRIREAIVRDDKFNIPLPTLTIGSEYLIQVHTDLSVGPAEVLSAFASAAGAELLENKLVEMPQLEITNNQVYLNRKK